MNWFMDFIELLWMAICYIVISIAYLVLGAISYLIRFGEVVKGFFDAMYHCLLDTINSWKS